MSLLQCDVDERDGRQGAVISKSNDQARRRLPDRWRDIKIKRHKVGRFSLQVMAR